MSALMGALWERGGPFLLAITLVGVVAWSLLASVAFALRRAGAPEQARETLRLVQVCLGIAPLLGLLGTVSGLTATFAGLAASGRSAVVAAGVGQALVTTLHGLLVAAPGALALALVSRAVRRREGQG